MRGSILDLGLGSDGTHRWKLRVYTGRDIVTGKRQFLSRNVRGGRRVAERKLNSMLTEVEEGRTAATRATVSYLMTEWLRFQESQGLSSTTIGSRISYIDNRITPALGNIALADLTARHLDEFYAHLSGELSARSIHHIHATIHRALAQAMKWGWLEHNVADRASPPRVTTEKFHSVELDVLAKILGEARRRDPRVERMIVLAALTGVRRGELCGLRWSDCDVEGSALTIRRAVKWSARRGIEVGPTKIHAERSISLDALAVEVLRQQIASNMEISTATGLDLPEDPYLFPGPDLATPLNPDRITGAFRRAAAAIGHRDLHFHSLRHFSASQLIAAGVDIRTVSGRLGHSDPSVTLRVYAHVLEAKDREAAEIMGRLLGK